MADKTKGGPAFPFYAQDFLVGVMHLENDEIGGYIKLLAYQWVKGAIPYQSLKKIIGADFESIWAGVKDKFLEIDGSYYNLRMEEERVKREAFSDKQSKNGLLGGRPPKGNKPKNNPNKSQTKAKQKPLEKENESESEKEKENKIDNKEIIKIFNSVCKNLPKVSKLTPSRNAALNARIKEYNFKTLGDVFILVSQSPFLNGDNEREWVADFDWILQPKNFIKIIEKKYNGTKSRKNVGKTNARFSESLQQRINSGLQS